MKILCIAHCAIRTVRLEECRTFYRDILGLTEGPRPPFSVPGIWFYSGEHPLVHITYVTETSAAPPAANESSTRNAGYLDHVAFHATGLAEMIERLARNGIPFREIAVPGINLYQLFIRDPDGVMIELDYSLDEASGRSPSQII